jgi:hypothetical protein|tara:strand:+ start:422 stop:598 length:177 start_codon:yes stop_codon:yes gene_type:complete
MKYRITIIETNVWSTDVDANNKYEAINKAENNHAKKPTFEFYNDESSKLDFECKETKQ